VGHPEGDVVDEFTEPELAGHSAVEPERCHPPASFSSLALSHASLSLIGACNSPVQQLASLMLTHRTSVL